MAEPSSASPLLAVRDLVKAYGEIQAVRGVSFEIREGICFGLLGPNGAGKTTTIEMIEGIHPPTSGEILWRGEPVTRGASRKRFHERIGIQFQSTALPDHLRVDEAVRLFRGLYPHGAEVGSIIEWCALGDILGRDCNRLSGGQRQRLLLALGLVNDPELIFLDEPTTGLDPQARRNFWELIRDLKRRGKTVVLTTHYMEEAFVLCDEIAIMDHGKIIAQGAPERLLKQHYNGLSIRLARQAFKDATIPLESIPGKVFERPGGGGTPEGAAAGDGDEIEIQTDDVDATFRALMAAGIPLGSLRVRQRDLEDLFLDVTGKGLRG